MKNAFLLLLLLIGLSAQGQNQHLEYPSYAKVLSQFFDHYSVSELSSEIQIQFEKRPTGWHVVATKYDGKEQVILNNALLWDSQEKIFRNVNFDTLKTANENDERLKSYLYSRPAKFFNICPFYGYPSWDWDVIRTYNSATNLPDSIMYGLGRAYSSFAGNLLHSNSGLANEETQFNLPEGPNSMDALQLEKYRLYRHHAIETFNKVAEMNPDFKTVVGSIKTKAANEYVTAYLDLSMFQNEEEAKKELVDGLYNKFHISNAKNFLMSCPPNAILFTYGDNDTYPLLYVQAQLGYRTDVMVVNLSLLNTSRYINYLRNPVLNAPALPISFTAEELRGHARELVVVSIEQDVPMGVDALVDFVKRKDNVKTLGNASYFYVPTNAFEISHGEEVLQWEVQDRYFMRNQLMVFDVLANNQWKRPICYASTIATSAFFGLQDYFQLEGFVYTLGTSKKEQVNAYVGTVNTDVSFDLMTNKFDWSAIKTVTMNEKWQAINYLLAAFRTVDTLIGADEQKKAKALLNKCYKAFPNELIPYDGIMLSMIENYYKIGEFKRGTQVAKQLGANLKKQLKTASKGENATAAERQLNLLKTWAQEYEQDDLIKALKAE